MSDSLFRSCLNLVYPPVCAFCRHPCQPVASYPGLCRRCLASLPLLPDYSAGLPWPDLAGVDVPEHDRVYALAAYQDPLRQALIRLKFSDQLDVAKALAPLMARLIKRQAYQNSLLVAVPLHPDRLHARGYNQAREIVRELSLLTHLPDISDCLQRIRPTLPQSRQQSREDRLANLSRAFSLLEAKWPRLADGGGKSATVWLVDDVMTTGATLVNAARPFWHAGIHVQGLVAAVGHVPFSSIEEQQLT